MLKKYQIATQEVFFTSIYFNIISQLTILKLLFFCYEYVLVTLNKILHWAFSVITKLIMHTFTFNVHVFKINIGIYWAAILIP